MSRKLGNMNAMHGVGSFKIFSMALDILKFVTRNHECMLMRDFMRLLQCKWDLCSSRMLRSVDW